MERCPDCGADQLPESTCQDCFNSLLAFELEHPEAFGAVHHLTVSCFYLQHPRGYAHATLRAWRDLVAASLDGTMSTQELRDLHGKLFGGATRMREPGAKPPAGWPRAWPVTIHEVITPDAVLTSDQYVRRSLEWAAGVRAALDAADGGQR